MEILKMSRELKFRAWNNKEKSWAVGSDMYLRLDGKAMAEIVSDKLAICGIDNNGDIIIEQYTGPKDKNGKEIYEGDIVRLYEHDWWDGKIVKHHKKPRVEGNFVVYYDDDLAAFEMENTQPYDNGIRGIEPFGYASQEYEVVGNIHENPELIKEK